MKLLKTLATIMMIALIPLAYSGCESTDDESCEQQDMNGVMDCGSEKNVEVCCTSGSDCVYKFDGQEYPDTTTGLNDLADALGCEYKSAEENQADKSLVISYLIALKERALEGIY
jgi:hypothetical protein